MNNFSQFDQFLIDLAKEINQSPESTDRIINKAIKCSECPYLKEKLKGYVANLKQFQNRHEC